MAENKLNLNDLIEKDEIIKAFNELIKSAGDYKKSLLSLKEVKDALSFLKDFSNTKISSGLDLKEFEKSVPILTEIQKKIAQTNNIIEQTATSRKQRQKELEDAFKAEEKAISSVTKEVIKLQKAEEQEKIKAAEKSQLIAILSKKYAENNATLAEQSKLLGLLKDKYRNSSEELREKMIPEIQKLDKVIKNADAQIGNFQRNVGNYPKGFKSFGDGISKIQSAISSIPGVGVAIGAISTALGSVMDNFKKIIEFEKQVSNLKALTGLKGDDLRDLSSYAITMGANFGIAGKDVVEAMKLIGGNKPELLNYAEGLKSVTEQALILAKASGLELPDAAKRLTDAMNQFNLPASEAARTIDVLTASAKAGSAEVPDLTDALLKFGTIAKDSNISIEESAALIETLAEKGQKGGDAGTGIRNIVLIMDSIKSSSKEAREELAKHKVNLDIVSDSSVPFAKRLEELAKIQGDATSMAKLFGKENITVGNILLSNIESFTDYTEKVKENGVAMAQMKDNTDNLAGDLDKMGSAWDKLILNMNQGRGTISLVGRGFVSVITDMLNAVDKFSTDAFSDKLKSIWNMSIGLTQTLVTLGLNKAIPEIDEAFARMDLRFKDAAIGKKMISDTEALQMQVEKAEKALNTLYDTQTKSFNLKKAQETELEMVAENSTNGRLKSYAEIELKRRADEKAKDESLKNAVDRLEKEKAKKEENEKSAEASYKKITDLEKLRIESLDESLIKQLDNEKLRYTEHLNQYKDIPNAKEYIDKIHFKKAEEIFKKHAENLQKEEYEMAVDRLKLADASNKQLLEKQLEYEKVILDTKTAGTPEYEKQLLKTQSLEKAIYKESSLYKFSELTKDRDKQIEYAALTISDEKELAQKLLEIQIDSLKKQQELLYAGKDENPTNTAGISSIQILIDKAQAELKKMQEGAKGAKGESSMNWLSELFNIPEEDKGKFEGDMLFMVEKFKEGTAQLMDSLSQWQDMKLQSKEQDLQVSNDKIATLEDEYKTELDYKKQGLANNADAKKVEIDAEKKRNAELKKERDKAFEDKKKMERAQLAMDTITQGSSMITASAKIISGFASIPVIGVALGIAAIAAMWGAFVIQKAMMMKSINSDTPKLAEGGWIKGKSHAEGGVKAELEGNEFVVRKEHARKYEKELEAINQGRFMNKLQIGTIKGQTTIINNDYSKLLKEQQKANHLHEQTVNILTRFKFVSNNKTVDIWGNETIEI